MSDSAPIVQKCVRCAMAPNASASTNAAHSTCVVSACSCASFSIVVVRSRRVVSRRRQSWLGTPTATGRTAAPAAPWSRVGSTIAQEVHTLSLVIAARLRFSR